MAAPAILSQGTTFSTDTVGGSSPITISGVKSVSGIGSGKAAEIDVTTLASTAREFRMGLQDFGSVTLNHNWNLDDAGQIALYNAMDGQTAQQFIITLPATNPSVTKNVWTATVYVLSMEVSVEANGVAVGTTTLRVTGEPVWS
jgi:hypothetical protein